MSAVTDIIVPAIVGLTSAALTAVAFVSASRANREQARSVTLSVDADAYTRAREIYESSIKNLRTDITALEAEGRRQRETNAELTAELARTRRANSELTDEVASLRREMVNLQSEINRLRGANGGRGT